MANAGSGRAQVPVLGPQRVLVGPGINPKKQQFVETSESEFTADVKKEEVDLLGLHCVEN